MRLILVRHGETNWNRERRIQGGFTDIELNEVGRKQAEKIALALKEEKLTAIYSSPLKRALKTAQAIAKFHGLKVETDPALREINSGKVDGLSLEEIKVKYAAFWKEWREGKDTLRFPEGESLEQLQERAWGAIQRIRERHPDGAVIVVCHVFTILATICRALELELGNFRRLEHNVAGISIIDFKEGKASLVLFNDTCHLKEG